MKFKNFVISYFKSLNWIALLGIAIFSIALAVINNVRLGGSEAAKDPDSKSVEWIGTQDVMEKPGDVM